MRPVEVESMADFPLPELRSSLEPYIKTHQETIQIRRVLTALLNPRTSALGFNDPVTLSPAQKARVNSIVSNAVGKRKAYARAVLELEKARAEHRSLTQAV